MPRKVARCTLLCALSLFAFLHQGATADGSPKECLEVDAEDLEGYLREFDLSTAPTVEVMAGGFKCSVTSLPFGALKSDWARLILLRDAQPESSILREKLGRLLRILAIAYYQREERFEILQDRGTFSRSDGISNGFPSTTEVSGPQAEPVTAPDTYVNTSERVLLDTVEEKSNESDTERTALPVGEYFITRKDDPSTLMTYDVEPGKKRQSDIGVKIDATPFSFDTKGTSYYFTSTKMDEEGGKTEFPPASERSTINFGTVEYSDLDDGRKFGLGLNNITLDSEATEFPSTSKKMYSLKTSILPNIVETLSPTEEYSTDKLSITTDASGDLSTNTSLTSNGQSFVTIDFENSTESNYFETTLASVNVTSKVEENTSTLQYFSTTRFTSETDNSNFTDDSENKEGDVTNLKNSTEETIPISVTASNEMNTGETSSVKGNVESTTWSPFQTKDSTLMNNITTISSTHFFGDTATSRNDISTSNPTMFNITNKYVDSKNGSIIKNYPDPSLNSIFGIIKYYNSSKISSKGNRLYYKPSSKSTKSATNRDVHKIPLSADVSPSFNPRKTIVAFEGLPPRSGKRGSSNADTEPMFRWFYKLDSDYSEDTNASLRRKQGISIKCRAEK